MSAKIVGKIVRRSAEIIMVFKVDGRYYAADDHNKELFEAYLHTGDTMYLDQLEGEIEP